MQAAMRAEARRRLVCMTGKGLGTVNPEDLGTQVLGLKISGTIHTLNGILGLKTDIWALGSTWMLIGLMRAKRTKKIRHVKNPCVKIPSIQQRIHVNAAKFNPFPNATYAKTKTRKICKALFQHSTLATIDSRKRSKAVSSMVVTPWLAPQKVKSAHATITTA